MQTTINKAAATTTTTTTTTITAGHNENDVNRITHTDTIPNLNKDQTSFYTTHRAMLNKYVVSGQMTSSDADACSMMVNNYYTSIINNTHSIQWQDIQPLTSHNKLDLVNDNTVLDTQTASKLLNEVVMLRLNGGLGTSMGCSGPKALINVSHEKSFFELVMRQTASIYNQYGVNLPLVFMNSLKTDALTKQAINEISSDLEVEQGVYVNVQYFQQPVYPRLDPKTLLPSLELESLSEEELWYPPGHASVFQSFVSSGLAQKLYDAGKRWVFVANVDNLGAWPDPNILANIEKVVEEKKKKNLTNRDDIDKDVPVFFMETTKKTFLDVKGGAPVLYQGKTYLLEAVQVPEEHKKDFEDIKYFELFNTGNLWINLEAWIKLPNLPLPIMSNPKNISVKGENIKVLQLESGVGTALSILPSYVIEVPRKRFIPVKLTSDLLRLRSDLYNIDFKTGFLEQIGNDLPRIQLSKEFAFVKDFESRVKGSVSLISTKSLILDGNIILEDGVKFIGNVKIHSHEEKPLELGNVYINSKIE